MYMSNTSKSVLSDTQTLRSGLKKRGKAWVCFFFFLTKDGMVAVVGLSGEFGGNSSTNENVSCGASDGG